MDADTIKWIAGISIPVVVTIAVFAGNRIAKRNDERKKEQGEKLRKHFDELYEEIKATLSDIKISEMYGLIVTYAGGIPQYHPDLVAIELPKLADSFDVHFPKEAKEYRKHINDVLRNNKSYQDLREKIKADFESESVPIVNINPPPTTSPVIYDTIFWPLFSWWDDRSQGKTKPNPTFEQIETIADFGPNHLVASGWHSGAIAYAVASADKQRCKEIITRIAYKAEYEGEAARIIHLANEILRDFRVFKGQVDETLEDINKLWPGTKTRKFKKEKKKCARCKQIFD